MNQLRSILFLASTLISIVSFSTTWDEPWQDKVIQESDYFVFAKIKSSDEKKGVTIEIIKSLGGKELKGKIKISNFYLLKICSYSSGHGAEFNFESDKECYFFIKKNKKNEYCIATPSAGFAYLKEGNVYATYRHSYHQALVPVETYEKTMTAIFKNYHGETYDKKYITEFITQYLSLKPAALKENEVKTFFDQHVALECIYHLRLPDFYSKIIPFLHDTLNFHNQTSAARSLISYNTETCKQELLNIIADTNRSHFVQVICVWTLSEFKPTELKEQLIKVKEFSSTEENGFGGNFMDPRVCTHFPDVKSALEKLISIL